MSPYPQRYRLIEEFETNPVHVEVAISIKIAVFLRSLERIVMIINNNIRFRMDNLEGSNFISQDEF